MDSKELLEAQYANHQTRMTDPVFTDMTECCQPDWSDELQSYIHTDGCTRD